MWEDWRGRFTPAHGSALEQVLYQLGRLRAGTLMRFSAADPAEEGEVSAPPERTMPKAAPS
eukprot:7098828-Alexandrium_andersonii.AAC.1